MIYQHDPQLIYSCAITAHPYTAAYDTTKQPVPQPEKKPPSEQKEGMFGVYSLTLLDREE